MSRFLLFGCFLLLLSPAPRAADVSFYVVAKGQSYVQTNSTPILAKDLPFAFDAFVIPGSSNTVKSARLRLPNASTRELTLSTNGLAINFLDQFTSQAQLDAKYPIGNYG